MPSAILRSVVLVRVKPVEAHAFGTFSHIGKEIIEAVPTFCDSNALTAIPLVLAGFGVIATLVHMAPRLIGTSSCVSMCGEAMHAAA